jgi:hypothetical protein
MTFTQIREKILLRIISTIQQETLDKLKVDTTSDDPNYLVLAYAMAMIGDHKSIVAVGGSFRDLLETNDIAHREIRTSYSILRTIGSTIIAFSKSDGRPLAIHGGRGQTLVFDALSRRTSVLGEDLELKS